MGCKWRRLCTSVTLIALSGASVAESNAQQSIIQMPDPTPSDVLIAPSDTIQKKFAMLTASELEGVRQKIQPCWNPPAGNQNTPIVTLIVQMNQNGTPVKADFKDTERYNNEPYYRAAADAAHRAIMNPRCQPFPLSSENYSNWRTITFNFDARDVETPPPKQPTAPKPAPPQAAFPPVNLPPPGQLPCEWAGNGDEGVPHNKHYLGDKPGFVIINYNLLERPDHIKVIHHGKVIASSPGPGGGRGSFGFDWKPVDGEYSIDVVATGAMFGTRWMYAMACPH